MGVPDFGGGGLLDPFLDGDDPASSEESNAFVATGPAASPSAPDTAGTDSACDPDAAGDE